MDTSLASRNLKIKHTMTDELIEEPKVKDEEPEPKRLHVSETQDSTEEIWEPPPYWDQLPYHIVVQVYSNLEISDRQVMAQVCQAWYTSFKDPSLWRSCEFTLGGPRGINMISFLSVFGRYLQNVVIRFQLKFKNAFKYIAEVVENLMEKLENSRLCRLHFLDMDLHKFRKHPALRDTVVGSLIKMLKSQTSLKHVVFDNCQFHHGQGTEVLKALQDSSGQTLESLEIMKFFFSYAKDFEEQLLKFDLFYTDLQKFTNLREIGLHYSSITEEMLVQLILNLKKTLISLGLYVLDYEDNFNVITSPTWRTIAKACPQLQVDLIIHQYFLDIDVIQLMAPGIPLKEFGYVSNLKTEQEMKLVSILKHLADYFDKQLETFKLVIPYLQDSVDNEIIRIVEKCRKLKKMRVPTSAAIGVADILRNDFRQRHVKKVRLEKCRFENLENSEPYQDIDITFQDKLDNSPDLTVQWVNEE